MPEDRFSFKDTNFIKDLIEACLPKTTGLKHSIIFTGGTMVSLGSNCHPPLQDEEQLQQLLSEDYPYHRLKKEGQFEEHMVGAKEDFQWSLTTAFPDQCRQAYGCLLRAGYPLPGGMCADRDHHCIDDHHYFLEFPHCGGECIATLMDVSPVAGVARQHVFQYESNQAAERRRLDFMFPKPKFYIDEQNNLHVL